MSDRLKALLEKARHYQMCAAEREAQHISFAYGNAKYENDKVTREGIIRASEQREQRQPNPSDERVATDCRSDERVATKPFTFTWIF